MFVEQRVASRGAAAAYALKLGRSALALRKSPLRREIFARFARFARLALTPLCHVVHSCSNARQVRQLPDGTETTSAFRVPRSELAENSERSTRNSQRSARGFWLAPSRSSALRGGRFEEHSPRISRIPRMESESTISYPCHSHHPWSVFNSTAMAMLSPSRCSLEKKRGERAAVRWSSVKLLAQSSQARSIPIKSSQARSNVVKPSQD